ncbi:CPBP family intramembrane glutamic endopeptidase [Levilactobacillus namurensis]|uniref:CPBP family intramembrane glutamic endopeptidase n=1 Tax=Levilactobacillus namurensis TaxID=380393 RepID=UPI0026EF0A03|nr:type II CAAX endopeptidase family protein [Levilactobacillus namurensis]
MQNEKRPANARNWLWVILLVILANLVQLPLVQLSHGTTGHRLVWAVIYLGGFGIAVGLAAWRYRKLWRTYHYRRLIRQDWKLMVGAYLAMLVAEEGLNYLNMVLAHQTTTANNRAIATLMGQSPWVMVLMATTAICASPFLEEFTFRGILMDGCLSGMGRWVPILGSAIAFSLVHLSTTWVSGLLYAVMGGTFAYVYQRTGKIQATIILHGFNNLLAMGLLVLTL